MSWIGVDLDGTLAEYHGPSRDGAIGRPVPAMVERVRGWIAEGREVRVVTARVSSVIPFRDRERAWGFVVRWCVEHVGFTLAVTAEKDFELEELWDDRAVRVETNTGRLL